jgi:D-alanine-D-alanine ligase
MRKRKFVENKSLPKHKNNKQKTKALGPVLNLEKYVHPDWWRSIFNSLYLKTDSDVVDDKDITEKEIDLFLQILNLSLNNNILDLCCGQGRHSLELARRGFKYVEGLDCSRYLIQKAKHCAQKENLNIRFREGDARKLPYLADSFDIAMILGNSFGYFETMNDDLRVLSEIFRILKPKGDVLIDVADGGFIKDNFQKRTWEWIDQKKFVCRERSLSKDRERLISREVVSHVEKGVIADQFYAERLYTKETLSRLLEIAGFDDITFYDEITTDSKRNQDLGMMQRRLIVSAKNGRGRMSSKKDIRNRKCKVAAVFGDPYKKDILKPGMVFDDDDIDTINQLKSALKDLSGYKFIYLNNHDILSNELMKLKGNVDYVFNLCDEGFNNDAALELHIPALLEIIGLPYTGSGPKCLAFCYDKSLVRGIAKEMGIPVPEALFVKPEDDTFELGFDFPVIIKPNFGDGGFGITQKSVTNTVEELFNAVSQIRKTVGYDKPILIEEFLGGKDLSVGIIGNPPENYRVLPIVEEDYSVLPAGLPKICGYEAKWLTDSPYWNIKTIPVKLSEKMGKFIVECCLKLFERLECRDYCRFDWRLDLEGNPKLLEVNPNPAWCWDGHIAKMAQFAGFSYSGMLKMILNATEKRLKL